MTLQVSLSTGVVDRMTTKEVSSEMHAQPVLQVTELKPVATTRAQQLPRIRLMLSDGCRTVQGMLGSNSNHLVESNQVQVGSIIQLNTFACNWVQNRLIVIIVELEVVKEKWEMITNIVPAPRSCSNPVQLSNDQPMTSIASNHISSRPNAYGARAEQSSVMSNNNTFGGGNSVSYGTNVNQNVGGTFQQQPRINQLQSDSYTGQPVAARHPAANASVEYPKVDSCIGVPQTAQMHQPYNGQSTTFLNPRAEVSRSPSMAEVSRSPSMFTRPTGSGYQQPPRMYASRGPAFRNEVQTRVVPITALNPYVGKWTIKGRVTIKAELRNYSNSRGEGKVFSFDLLDADGGEIRATCFNAVADNFYNQIEAGRVYLVSNGSLKPAQRDFNHLSNNYAITLDNTSVVQLCPEDNSIPQVAFNFRDISDIESMDIGSIIDIIGMVSFISPAGPVMCKNGKEKLKRSLHLKDMSGRSVELTLWGNICNAEGKTLQSMCDNGRSPVLAVKACKVSDFNGRSVGTLFTSQLLIEPDIAEAHSIREWFNKAGRDAQSISISRSHKTDSRKTISQIKDEKLGTSENPDFITVAATITYIKLDSFCYTACPIKLETADRTCAKKVTNNGDGKWWCDRCDRSVDECDYRYIINFQIQDHTGITWVTAFDEAGVGLIGMSAKELYCLKYENQNDDKFMEITRQVMFRKYIFKLRVKEEIYSDEQRVKSHVTKVEKVDFASEARYLLGSIDKIKNSVSDPFAPTHPGMNISVTGADESRMMGVAAAASREYMPPSSNQMQPLLTTGVSGARMFCDGCGLTGHSSVNCPRQSGDRVTFSGGGTECFKCRQPGHWAKDCPATTVYSNSPNKYSSVVR